MTEILAFAARAHSPQRLPEPSGKPVAHWVIDPMTGRPVMAWSLPQAAAEKIAA